MNRKLKAVAVVLIGVSAYGLFATRRIRADLFNPDKPDIWDSRVHPVASVRGMVVADDRQAAEWGVEILRKGGNAMDAAVATGFAMSVTRPQFAALGSGGFMVYCPRPDANGKGAKPSCTAIDFREQAPAAAKRDMYVRDGKAVPELSQNGALSVGVPGITAGLLLALEKFGSKDRALILSKPIALARDGIRWSTHSEAGAAYRWPVMNDEGKKIFGCPSGGGKSMAACPAGTLLKQPELAKVLSEISRLGTPGFYEGWVAKKIAASVKSGGGIITLDDLKKYSPKIRVPVVGKYRGLEVVSMPPPSSGGLILLQMLGYADRADAQKALDGGYGSASTVHALAHAMTLAFADRTKYLGDPEFYHVPSEKLLSPEYLNDRWKTFNVAKANIPDQPGLIDVKDYPHTTHFSVIDKDGNAVSITITMNDDFGSGFVAAGTGVLLNDQMDDFSAQPGAANLFGLIGGEANSIQPHKRPLSSMSPTIVRDDKGMVKLIVGAAGGSRIITSTFQTIVNRLRFGMSLPDAVASARIHHQWRPKELEFERYGYAPEVRSKLHSMGWEVTEESERGEVHALERFSDGRIWGAADTRAEGAAVGE